MSCILKYFSFLCQLKGHDASNKLLTKDFGLKFGYKNRFLEDSEALHICPCSFGEVENLKNDFAILKDKQDKAAILEKDKDQFQEKCEQTNDRPRPTTNATTQTPATTEESMESQLSTLIKENLQLRKENKEMKDRMTILNRVIEEMLDQQDINRNSSQVLNERHCRHWEHQSRKGRERKYEGRDKEFYSTRNRFQQLADLSDDEFNTQDETISYHHERSRSQNTSNFRKVQTRQERNNKVNLNYRTNAADIDKSTMNAKRILIIGDSELYGIDQSKMPRTHAIKVKAQGGLKIEGLEDLLQQEIQHGPDEVIVHVGVNNLESSTDDEILSSFKIY